MNYAKKVLPRCGKLILNWVRNKSTQFLKYEGFIFGLRFAVHQTGFTCPPPGPTPSPSFNKSSIAINLNFAASKETLEED